MRPSLDSLTRQQVHPSSLRLVARFVGILACSVVAVRNARAQVAVLPADLARESALPAGPSQHNTELALVAAVSPGPARVRLDVHTSPGYELSARLVGESDFQTLCSNDCSIPWAKGLYELGLWRPGGTMWIAEQQFEVARASRVDALVKERRNFRIAGGLLVAAGVISGVALVGRGVSLRSQAHDACDMHGGSAECDKSASKVGRPQLIAGISSALLSAALGAILLTREDRMQVRMIASAEDVGFGEAQYEPAVDQAAGPPLESDDERRKQAEDQLREQHDAIRKCVNQLPVTIDMTVAEDGAIKGIRLFGDAERSEQQCLFAVLQTFSFPAGRRAALSLDLQPLLR